MAQNTSDCPQIEPLPMSAAEVAARGWDAVDVVFVTGDAYVDHPSFAMAILGRVLEAEGFRVAILSQPDWRSCHPWRQFGRPRLCFAISAGNLDSMLNHYTAARKVRNDDAYSPGGEPGRRPDRATIVYAQRAREAYPNVPIVIGGVEASLRRVAHYDYWSDSVRRSIIFDAKADLLVYGMGEKTLTEIVHRLAGGATTAELRHLRGIAYRLGAREAARWISGDKQIEFRPNTPDTECEAPEAPYTEGAARLTTGNSERFGATAAEPCDRCADLSKAKQETALPPREQCVLLPSFEEVSADKNAFLEMTRLIEASLNPYSARPMVQFHGREAVVVNPPALPLTQEELDRIYDLPFTRRPHPSYGRRGIPAYEVVKNSIQIVRGCFGGCAFCSLTAHQGRFIQSRSEASVLAEVRRVAQQFSGVISDLGGPTANMYAMGCSNRHAAANCRRQSCLFPSRCKLLNTDHRPLLRLLEAAQNSPGVRKILIASGIRMDLALCDRRFIRIVAKHHTGGRLKVAPEHCSPRVLARMRKPGIAAFERFAAEFASAAEHAGKRAQIVPYFMAGHPGCSLDDMIELALYLKRTGYRPEKVQDFIPLPMEPATCMYYTGRDPQSGETVETARGEKQRRWQRALLQFFLPKNYADVRAALEAAGRTDLIGEGPQCLIPSRPPRNPHLLNSPSKKNCRCKQASLSRKDESDPTAAARLSSGASDHNDAELPETKGLPRVAGYRPFRKSKSLGQRRQVSPAESIDQPRPNVGKAARRKKRK